jgi:hypothetical protein
MVLRSLTGAPAWVAVVVGDGGARRPGRPVASFRSYSMLSRTLSMRCLSSVAALSS